MSNIKIVNLFSNFNKSKVNLEGFKKELFELYDKYDISIGHEDTQGEFRIESNHNANREWISEAIDGELDYINSKIKEYEDEMGVK